MPRYRSWTGEGITRRRVLRSRRAQERIRVHDGWVTALLSPIPGVGPSAPTSRPPPLSCCTGGEWHGISASVFQHTSRLAPACMWTEVERHPGWLVLSPRPCRPCAHLYILFSKEAPVHLKQSRNHFISLVAYFPNSRFDRFLSPPPIPFTTRSLVTSDAGNGKRRLVHPAHLQLRHAHTRRTGSSSLRVVNGTEKIY